MATLYYRVQAIAKHDALPSDYGVKLSIGPYETLRSKYSQWFDDQLFANDPYAWDYIELSIVAATFDRSQYVSGLQNTYTYSADFTRNYEYSVWGMVTVPNTYVIPPHLGGGSSFGGTGPNGMFGYTDANRTQVSWQNVNFDFSTNIVGSLNFGSFVASTEDTFFTLAENAAMAAGFSGLSTAMRNVSGAATALHTIVTGGADLIAYGVKNFDRPHFTHANFDKLATEYMSGAAEAAHDALLQQTLFPGSPNLESTADAILDGVRMVGTGSFHLSTSATFGIELEVLDFVSVGVSYTATAEADIIIQPGLEGTVDGGDGNDFIVTGTGHQRIIGGAGNDYVFAGSGNDEIVAGPGSTVALGGGAFLPGDYFNGGSGFDTVIWNAPLSNYSLRLSGLGTTDIASSQGSTLTKQVEVLEFSDGRVMVDSGNPLTDNLYYASHYLDVFHFGMDPFQHYNRYGWKEGRNPNEFFSTTGYLNFNSDVDRAGVNPLLHYQHHGWREGRDPSVNFSAELYLIRNPDVEAAGIDPLTHYLHYGRMEGRNVLPSIGSQIVGAFDREYYLLANPDVARSGLDAQFHFNTYGWREGRDPNAFFDTDGYLAHNQDVAAAGMNPLTHYETYGWAEGRDPSMHFDVVNYLQTYLDVDAANIDPLKHFLEYGAWEGRDYFDDGAWGHPTVVTSYSGWLGI